MRITCPTCAAAYDVPAERLVGGRMVRCARCGSGWVPPMDESVAEPPVPVPAAVPEVPAPAPPEAAEPRLPEPKGASPQALAAAAGVRRRFPGIPFALPVLLAWVGSLVLLGVLGWAMIAWRSDVARVWPPSERLYSALGLLRR